MFLRKARVHRAHHVVGLGRLPPRRGEIVLDLAEEVAHRVAHAARERTVLDLAARLGGVRPERLEADVVEEAEGVLTVWVEGELYRIEYQEEGRRPRRAASVTGQGMGGRQMIVAPMPGKVVALLVSPEQEVSAGQGVIVIEAMKMENELKASGPGVIKEIKVQEGDGVSGGDVLVVIE